MAGTRSKVGSFQVLQVFEMEDGFVRCLLCRLHKILPFVLQLILVWIVIKIDASDGVLHHVLHDPVGRENLSGRCNLIRVILSFLGKGFIFTVRDIELVEPAYQFRSNNSV